MKRNMRIAIIVTISGIIIASMFFLGKYNPFNNINTGYLLDKKVPGIVKGTAKMVDTEAYFTKYDLQESSVRLDFICNNSNNLRIALGYKSPTSALMLADYPTKEIVIWSGEDIFSESSSYYKSENEEEVSRITKEWDLLSIGFTEDEYVKADERIWYLRINELSSGAYGYEKNVTEVINGKEFLIPEFIPNIHYIEEFKLVFNQLIFETMLYPFFDGSKEIIIPIRGVNHELAIEDQKTDLEIRGMGINSWSTTTPSTGAGNMWAVVFGTSNYVYALSTKLDYPPMECRCFMLGSEKETTADAFKVGVMDYGWRVAYCMDGNESQTDIATCEQTDDGFFESMLDFADGQLGTYGKLIVVVGCHGKKFGGNHMTMTGTSHFVIIPFFWIVFWYNVVKLNEYQSKIDDITSDGTHVLLWVGACHGNGLDSFSSSDHNYNLESWSFRDKHFGNYAPGSCTYQTFTWYNHIEGFDTVVPECEMAFFFLAAYEGTCEVTVSEVGEDIQTWYNKYWENETETGEMYIQKTWGSHLFYVNWGY
ncbi:MAG: hypothetical protein FK730_01270 [Asgard group archaeon]|nr:hypothetical protein [Asgard group archaeon]